MPARPASASATARTITRASPGSTRASSPTRWPSCTPGWCDMAEPVGPRQPLHLCASAELVERGQAYVFDVLHYREPARAFALRYDGRVVAYLNRCLHVPA